MAKFLQSTTLIQIVTLELFILIMYKAAFTALSAALRHLAAKVSYLLKAHQGVGKPLFPGLEEMGVYFYHSFYKNFNIQFFPLQL